jgi:hypothetical protein
MTFSLLFWILMLVWALTFLPRTPFGRWPNSIVLFALLALLGWRVFGAALHQ